MHSLARLGLFAGAVALAGVAVAACGDSDDGGGGKGGSGGTGASNSGGGSGGDGGAAGAAGAAGGGGSGGQTCGNGKLEGTEECDDGNLVSGDGCENTCDLSCDKASDCDDGDPCTGTESCGANHACTAGTPLAEGADCGSALVCVNGNCVSPQCGDGQKQTGEECDDGNATNGDGCDFCKFSCITTDATRDCTQAGDACAGSDKCDDAKHTCTAGTKLSEGAACMSGTGKCAGGLCTLLTCGDSNLDAGEECDPPAAGSCSPQCKKVVTATCGNGTIEPPEHCDDGKQENLDGCDSKCAYETVLRMIDLDIAAGAAPSYCSVTKNQLGNVALTAPALNTLNGDLQKGIDKGSTNVMIQLLGLDELTGTSEPSMELGVLSGGLDTAKGTWPVDGSNPIDWWFKADPTTVDAAGLPTGKLGNGSIKAKLLLAGPSNVDLTLSLGGSAAVLGMRDAKLRAAASGTPDVPTPPPASLGAGLKVFQELIANQGNQGLCGNVTVESLAKIPLPEALTTGIGACQVCPGSLKYTFCGKDQPVGDTCNSLLDALVGGCKGLACALTTINATQPDVAKSGGALTKLANQGALNKIPAAETNGNQDGYSAFMTFRARRAHVTGKK
ncbi:MAG: DUF4215 domain-containing protein [Myxococcales bacterium]|nr:DUF4215 domain-containing protein [Myxococcales bacterium]